jgi:tRNA (guanine-N7-)-methyltransferase
MRMRKKKWAQPELESSDFFIKAPEQLRGMWKSRFRYPERNLELELGCGKGVSTSVMAFSNPDTNFIAVDLISNVLGSARRNISGIYGDREPDNILLTAYDIMGIEKIFSEEDQVSRIHIYFPNPWTQKKKHKKRRLTHPRQLMQYRTFLKDGGEIWFKTDNDELFQDSLAYFLECGFVQTFITMDLHRSGFEKDYVTENEKMFSEEGIPIKFVIMKKEETVI